nr:hypothetical protein [Phycisphaerae bacterium]
MSSRTRLLLTIWSAILACQAPGWGQDAPKSDKDAPAIAPVPGQHEVPRDPYIVVPREMQRTTPALRWTYGRGVSVQVNV